MTNERFEAALPLTEFEAYTIAAAMKVAEDHSNAAEHTYTIKRRVTDFIVRTWPKPDAARIKAEGRVNILVSELDALLADAARWRTFMDPANVLIAHSLVERTKAEADAALDVLLRAQATSERPWNSPLVD